MTSKIEKEFYKVFEIKKREHAFLFSEKDGSKEFYPPITDRILLKLLCLLVNNVSPITFIAGEEDIGVKNLKNLILEACIKSYEIKEQVQQLFKEYE